MRYQLLAVVSAGMLAVGCSDSSTEPVNALSQTSPAGSGTTAPAANTVSVDPAVVASADAFMRAILSGDSQGAAQLLTAKAAQRYAADPNVLTPLGMPVERLEVGEVRMLDTDQAAAQCLVTVPGVADPQELLCLLKRGSAGWRVCGMACETGENDTTVISFEDAPEQVVSGQFVEGESEFGSLIVPKTASSPQGGELR